MIRCHCQNFIVTVNVRGECPSPAASSNTSLQSLNLRVFHSLVDRSLWQVAPDNLKHFLDFGDCFLHFKLAVSLQQCTQHAIVHSVYIQKICRPLVLCDEIWTDGPQPVMCAVCWRAVLLEDEPGGQPAIALKER